MLLPSAPPEPVESASIAEMTRRYSLAAAADGIEKAVQSVMETPQLKAQETSV